MTIVVVVALAGLIALLVAILTDNTFVAVGVIALAALGILLLLRDWRAERRQSANRWHGDSPARRTTTARSRSTPPDDPGDVLPGHRRRRSRSVLRRPRRLTELSDPASSVGHDVLDQHRQRRPRATRRRRRLHAGQSRQAAHAAQDGPW